MRKIMHILFLSCLKATELIEKKFHFKLSIKERLQLKMHKMMCEACTKYEKHSKLIEKGILNSLKSKHKDIELQNLKMKIHKKLQNQNKQE